MRRFVILFVVAACGGAQHTAARPTVGTIAGVARDHDSGEAVATAALTLRAEGSLAPLVAKSARDGSYSFGHLAPGRYSLSANFAGQPIDVEHIDVRAGETAVVDVTFTLGRPDPVHLEFNDAKAGAIDRYRPPHLSPASAIIEGTVSDAGSRDRVSGAVVYAVGPGTGASASSLQAVTDDQGRYKFDTVSPGTYAVSAYYSIGGRAQIEVRRSGIDVHGAEAVIVPLWIETAKQ